MLQSYSSSMQSNVSPSSNPLIGIGSYKLVVVDNAPVSIQDWCSPDKVAVILPTSELAHERDIFTYVDWLPLAKTQQQLNKVIDFCFARISRDAPSQTIEASELKQLQRDLANADSIEKFEIGKQLDFVLNRPSMSIVSMDRLEPLSHYNIIERIIQSQTSRIPDFIDLWPVLRAGISQFLLDIIQGCSIFACHQLCHGDIKIGNCLYDPRTRHFKLSDFGLSTTFGNIDYQNIYGKVKSPWYHPFCRAMCSLKKAKYECSELEEYCDSMIDRFAFMSLTYQLLHALGAYTPLLKYPDMMEEFRQKMRRLIFSFAQPLEAEIQSECNEGMKQLKYFWDRSDSLAKVHWEYLKDCERIYTAQYYGWIVQNKLYCILTWDRLFDAVVRWQGIKYQHHQSIGTYIDYHYKSKKVSGSARTINSSTSGLGSQLKSEENVAIPAKRSKLSSGTGLSSSENSEETNDIGKPTLILSAKQLQKPVD